MHHQRRLPCLAVASKRSLPVPDNNAASSTPCLALFAYESKALVRFLPLRVSSLYYEPSYKVG